MDIRKATPHDAEALHELYTRHLNQDDPPLVLAKWRQALSEMADTPGYHLLVGEIEGRIVSSATLVIIKNLTRGLRPYALIENVVTNADYRNQGHAGALMARAAEIAREHRCYKIMLMTGSKQESTLRFYEKCGFNRQDKTGFIKWL